VPGDGGDAATNDARTATSEIELGTRSAAEDAQGAAFDGSAPPASIEHQSSSPEGGTSTESAAPSTDTVEAQTPAPSVPALDAPTSMAAALAKAGLVKPDQFASLPAPPTRKRLCQVCGKSVDGLFWYEDREHDLAGHSDCVRAAVKSRQEEADDPGLPEAGQICEGAVFAVDASGLYALVDLLEYSRPERKLWVRGKVTRAQVLRTGWCEDVRDWLQAGDLVNVKVLDVTRGTRGSKPRLNLSIKQAPAHTHERRPLELIDEAPIPGGGAPIVTTGAQVAAQLAATGDRQAIEEQAMALIMTHHLDQVHLKDLADRIVAVGIDQATRELEADLKSMAALKSEAREKAAPDPVVKKAMEQMAAAPDLVRLEAETRARAEKAELDARMALKANKGLADELAAAQERNRQLEEQLSAARKGTDVALKSLHETEDKLAAAAETNARLEATTAALCKDIDAMHHDMNIGCGIIGRLEGEVREAAGLCPGCAHRLDGFCP
jgi:predicted RNA-binding protein with RPS1 domain/predicted  nucleic acid-binding Zn-ribbon protein